MHLYVNYYNRRFNLFFNLNIAIMPKDKHVQSVINKFAHRSEVGFAKYGTTLERKDLNLTEWLNHLQEELMDATLYIEKLKEEFNQLK